MARTPFLQNIATTLGLLFGYFGGTVKRDGAWSLLPDGTVALDNDAINYVELDVEALSVSATVIGFSAERIPLAKVATIDGEIVSVVDSRPAFIPGASGADGADGLDGEPGTPGALHGDGPPEDGVTGLGSSTKLYQNDAPEEDTAVLYVNIDPTTPSENPQWLGVNTISK